RLAVRLGDRMEVPNEEHRALGIELADHRHLSALRRLIKRDGIEALARASLVDHRLHVLLQVVPRELLQLLLRRAGHAVEEPWNADEETALARGDRDPLSRALLPLAVDANHFAGEVDRQLAHEARIVRVDFVSA